MNVHGRCIPAVRAAEQRLIAHHHAKILSQRGIPSLCKHHDAGERLAGTAIEPAGRRIGVGLERLLHRFDVVHAITREVYELVVVVLSELVQKLVPLLVVVI